MKNILSIMFLFALLASSCSEDELVKNQPINSLKFTATFEQNESRTYVEEGNLLRWTKGDQITLFEGNTLNRRFIFDGETGDNAGTFSLGENPYGTGNELNKNYAVYPYRSKTIISDYGGITATLPAEQSYAESSFGLGDNTMVAVTKDTDDTFLMFKNVGGYLKLQLYGDDVIVKSITLTGNNHEKIAGNATITPVYGEAPTIRMADDATESIILDCGESGIKLGTTKEAATSFWMVVPPTTFEKGFTITVTDIDGKVFGKTTSNEIIIARNTIHPMAVLKVAHDEVVYDTFLLPDGETFNSIVKKFRDNNQYLKKIKFIANSDIVSESILGTDIDGTKGYLVANEEWIEIHTLGKEFVANESCRSMFADFDSESFKYIEEIDFGSNFNTSNVTDMSYMFEGCYCLVSLDVSNFDTSSVTDMSYMFKFCDDLTSLDVSNFDTSNVTDMDGMFWDCSSLTSLDVSNFDTSNVTYMSSMFGFCDDLTSLDVSNFDTSNVTYMSYMFQNCSSLTSLDLSNFDTSNVTDMSAMFNSCSSLTSLDLTNFSFAKEPTVEYMLSGVGEAISKVVPIKVTEDGRKYLTETTPDCGIGTSADFVIPVDTY